jgi:hypothetical protein
MGGSKKMSSSTTEAPKIGLTALFITSLVTAQLIAVKLLVVTYKGEGATGIWDLQTGKELAKVKNSRLVTHGVSISPDNNYAFISVEGKNGEPGSVDVIDLHKLELAEVIEVGKQAGGIIHWKMSK